MSSKLFDAAEWWQRFNDAGGCLIKARDRWQLGWAPENAVVVRSIFSEIEHEAARRTAVLAIATGYRPE